MRRRTVDRFGDKTDTEIGNPNPRRFQIGEWI